MGKNHFSFVARNSFLHGICNFLQSYDTVLELPRKIPKNFYFWVFEPLCKSEAQVSMFLLEKTNVHPWNLGGATRQESCLNIRVFDLMFLDIQFTTSCDCLTRSLTAELVLEVAEAEGNV